MKIINLLLILLFIFQFTSCNNRNNQDINEHNIAIKTIEIINTPNIKQQDKDNTVEKNTNSLSVFHIYDIDVDKEVEDSDIISEKKVKEIAYQEVIKYCPIFFDFDSEYEILKLNQEFMIKIFQISSKSHWTGNQVHIRMLLDGRISAVSIHHDQDVSIVDNESAISNDEAIEIAYNASKKRLAELQLEMLEESKKPIDPSQIKPTEEGIIYNDLGQPIDKTEYEYVPYEADIDDRDNHDVFVQLTVIKNTQVWIIKIENIKNNQNKYETLLPISTTSFIVIVDANTGEVIQVGYSL